MPPNIFNGDYEIDQDANGDFVIRDPNGNDVFKYDDSAGEWIPANINLSGANITDGTTTVYDASTDTVGDGTNTSADHSSVTTDAADIGDLGNSGLAVPLSDDIDLSDQDIIETTAATGSPNNTPTFKSVSHRLSNTKKVQLDPDTTTPTGVLWIINHNNAHVGVFQLRRSTGVDEMLDPNAAYSTTEGNAGTVNIYYDSTNGRIELNNETGGTRDLYGLIFKAV